jgi:hypothetical protein
MGCRGIRSSVAIARRVEGQQWRQPGRRETPSLRKLPVEKLLADLVEDGGPLLYHSDSEEQQSSFESTYRKFRRFLTSSPL